MTYGTSPSAESQQQFNGMVEHAVCNRMFPPDRISSRALTKRRPTMSSIRVGEMTTGNKPDEQNDRTRICAPRSGSSLSADCLIKSVEITVYRIEHSRIWKVAVFHVCVRHDEFLPRPGRKLAINGHAGGRAMAKLSLRRRARFWIPVLRSGSQGRLFFASCQFAFQFSF